MAGIFDRAGIKKTHPPQSSNGRKKRTTKGFFLGYPEAEAEATPQSKIQLSSIYTDISLAENLNDSRFILVGKKGSGKSAFAKIIEKEKSANFFCRILRKNDIDIDAIVAACGGNYDYESVCRWVFAIQLLKLTSKSQSLSPAESTAILDFLQLNSGYVDFDKFALTKISSTKDIKVDISPFSAIKAFFGHQDKEEKDKPTFLQVLPSIEKLLQEILINEDNSQNGNAFLLFLDDLDHGFNAENNQHISNAYSLILAARNFNNEICERGNGKVILLMRDDIVRRIETHEAGSAKAISSYAYKIKWHDNNLRGEAERFNKLSEFLEKRLIHNYKKNNIQKLNKNSTHIEDFFKFSFPFKTLLDKSFHRPRDFLLMFNKIGDHPYEIPIDKYWLDKLLKQYKAEVIKEAKNELLAHLPNPVIDAAINVVVRHNKLEGIEYSDFQNHIRRAIPSGYTLSAEYVIERLYDASVIGQIKNSRNFFKYRQGEREEEAHLHDFEPGHNVLAHNIFRL